jgi:hypothetical protein
MLGGARDAATGILAPARALRWVQKTDWFSTSVHVVTRSYLKIGFVCVCEPESAESDSESYYYHWHSFNRVKTVFLASLPVRGVVQTWPG